MFVAADDVPRNWTGYTLVVTPTSSSVLRLSTPAVSVGNVGQLTADLLISTLWMNKVGYFYTDSVLPVVGNDPFATGEQQKTCNLSTSLEVFESNAYKYVVVQQRAPLVKGKRTNFVEMLTQWIYESKFSEVIILTSLFAHERLDSQLTGSQFRYLLSPKFENEVGDTLRNKLEWPMLERRAALVTSGGEADVALDGSDLSQFYLAGGGAAKHLFEKCAADGVKVAMLLLFVAEGDNACDAADLATKLNDWKDVIDLKKPKDRCARLNGWKVPSSWTLMYGNLTDPTIFG